MRSCHIENVRSPKDFPADFLLKKIDQSVRFRNWMALAVALKAVRQQFPGDEQAMVDPVLRLIRNAMRDLMGRDVII